MLIKCRSKSGSDIPEHLRVMGEDNNTDFSPLILGEEYEVYGLMFFSNRTDFLVCPKENGPMWVPSSLFSIVSDELPMEWMIVLTENKQGYSDLFSAFGVHAICGYMDLVRSYDHYVGIIERDPNALNIFYSNIYKE